MKILSEKNVLEAARERIAWLFDEFETVVLTVSGGKDSTVIYHLGLEEARRRGRVPLPVMFIDQEAEWTATINIMREWMAAPDVRPMWLQMPIHLDNATSFTTRWLKCWDEDERERWLREKEPCAITVNTYGTMRFAELFPAVIKKEFPGQRVAVLAGVRTEESPMRKIGLTGGGGGTTYKWVTWGRKLSAGQCTFYPIYDWTRVDVWKAIHDHNWRYNEIYDLQYRYGVHTNAMRVSNLHHETAVRSLFHLQEIDPPLYERLAQRLPGVDMAGKMGSDDYYATNLPPMFASWCEYRDHLLEKLVTDVRWRKDLTKTVAEWDEFYRDDAGSRESGAKAVIKSILTNDYTGTKIEGFKCGRLKLDKQDRIAETLRALPWRAAKTYAETAPHEYILVQDYPDMVEWLRREIRQRGTDEEFFLFGRWREYRVYRKDRYRYWFVHPAMNRVLEDSEQDKVPRRISQRRGP